MITILHIKNIGIIEDVTIELNNGFNVLTGETGSGKSLIIDSLKIICGGRFSKDMIMKDKTYSFVEICIYDESNEAAMEDGNIIISREIHLNGKNSCKINGRLVTVVELREFMKNVIEIHGQYDNQILFDIAEHIKIVDDFSNKDINILMREYRQSFLEYSDINLKLKENYGDEIEKQRKLDLLKYQLNEIIDVNLNIGEEEELEEKRKIMINYEKLSQNLNIVSFQIDSSVLSGLDNTLKALNKIQHLDKYYDDKINGIENIYYELKEINFDITEKINNLEFDEYECLKVNQRLDLINSLKRKYGNNIQAILDYRYKLENEITMIENMEEYNNNLKKKLNSLKENMFKLASKINEIRVKNCSELEYKINFEIKDLDMKNANFKIDIKFREDYTFNQNGLNDIEFLVATNAGQDFKSLSKIASGGEISRIMLAIKTVLTDIDKTPVIIFDEIDSGISGSAAKKVSEKIKKISKTHQVITVTHLPIITASADYNYKVAKEVKDNKTKTVVNLLKGDDVIKEIAWISAGNITNTAINHAIELKKLQQC
jgi:DNA repair protein RecN (Recombination protein N)